MRRHDGLKYATRVMATCAVALGLGATSIGCEPPERRETGDEAARDLGREVEQGEHAVRDEARRIGEDTRHELREEGEAVDRGELRGIDRAERTLEEERRRVEEDLRRRESERP